MNCKGDFVFKGVKRKDKGEFINDDGKRIEYPAKFQIKVDEIVDGEASERLFNFGEENVDLYAQLSKISCYTKVCLHFDVKLYVNASRLVPIGVEVLK